MFYIGRVLMPVLRPIEVLCPVMVLLQAIIDELGRLLGLMIELLGRVVPGVMFGIVVYWLLLL